MAADSAIPVIAIDGPSASGKGTVAQRVAFALGFHYLDSGALYRLVGLAARRAHASLDDAACVADIARALEVRFDGDEVYLADARVTDDIRSEAAGGDASRVAAIPAVRAALLARQRGFRRAPGLVADGRDMGSVVFPDATLKIFLTADVAARAERRYKQLIGKGMSANMAALLNELQARDQRDSARAVAPLQKTGDAILLDTTALTIDEAVAAVLAHYRKAQ